MAIKGIREVALVIVGSRRAEEIFHSSHIGLSALQFKFFLNIPFQLPLSSRPTRQAVRSIDSHQESDHPYGAQANENEHGPERKGTCGRITHGNSSDRHGCSRQETATEQPRPSPRSPL